MVEDGASGIEAARRLRRAVELGRRGRGRPDVVVHHRVGREQTPITPDGVDTAVAQQVTTPPRVALGVLGARGDARDRAGARPGCGEVLEEHFLHDLAGVAVDDDLDHIEAILSAEHVALDPGVTHELGAGHDVLAEVEIGVRFPDDPLGFRGRDHLLGVVTHL